MKKSTRIWSLAVLLAFACLPKSASRGAATNENDLPGTVGRCAVSNEVRRKANALPTTELRVAYLSSILLTNEVGTAEAENFRKASAIRLLGVIRSTNGIRILVGNIVFEDMKYHDKPAVEALVAIGEPATPHLLDLLKDVSATPEMCSSAVKALQAIKGAASNVAGWIRFMREQKEKLPREAGERLDKYGSILD